MEKLLNNFPTKLYYPMAESATFFIKKRVIEGVEEIWKNYREHHANLSTKISPKSHTRWLPLKISVRISRHKIQTTYRFYITSEIERFSPGGNSEQHVASSRRETPARPFRNVDRGQTRNARKKEKQKEKKRKNIVENFSRVPRDVSRPARGRALNIGTETKRSQGGPTTHGRPLLEYLWRLAVRDEFLSIRSVAAPSMLGSTLSISRPTEIAIFIHKTRLEGARGSRA